jgi:hypothetical protein
MAGGSVLVLLSAYSELFAVGYITNHVLAKALVCWLKGFTSSLTRHLPDKRGNLCGWYTTIFRGLGVIIDSRDSIAEHWRGLVGNGM